jgi:hypothetical protein
MRTLIVGSTTSTLLLLVTIPGSVGTLLAQQPSGWKQHEWDRPRPPVVQPVEIPLPSPVPADAVVLFGGDDLSAWQRPNGSAAEWTVESGYLQVTPGGGTIQTREGFGDAQLHIEWASPSPPRGTNQDRGNSGLFLMGRYEVQVLDSYQADTYADGQAGAIYGQYPPLANATRAPGEWQAYDIVFRRPRFSAEGSLLEPARVTVVHNGIVVQNNEAILGPTSYMQFSPYEAHPDEGPIQLQDHGHPVRFRNIWIRRLPERPAPPADYMPAGIEMTAAQLDRFVGSYNRGEQGQGSAVVRITRSGDHLVADINTHSPQQLTPLSPTEFVLSHTGGRLVFELDAQGAPTAVVFEMGGGRNRGIRAP